MNTDIEKMFVNKYIIKQKRERILYELCKPSKRPDALSRFCHDYDSYVDERKIIYRSKGVNEEEIKKLVEAYDEAEGYMICWDERYDTKNMTVDSAIPIMRDDGMCMIFILEDICIISTEQIQGAKEILVLRSNL